MNLTDARSLHAGWRARLELGFAASGSRTLLVQRQHRGPLAVQKALYPEGEAVCHTVILHPPGGIAAGDVLEVAVDVGTHAHALLTTPGATKWYRSHGIAARQDVQIAVAAGAVLEWLPQVGIVFDGARARSTQTVNLTGDASYVGWDIVCLGRAASGQRFDRGSWHSHTRLARNGRCLWNDHIAIEGGGRMIEADAGLAGHRVMGLFLAATTVALPAILSACRAVDVGANARAGLTALPGVLAVRALGDSSEQLWHYFARLWSIVRPAVLGRPACAPRIWNT